MKKIAVAAVALAAFIATQSASAQTQNAPDSTVHKVGLIDMKHVFENYQKFKDLRADLQAEIGKSDAEGQKMVKQMQALQENLKKFQQGTPQYEQAEKAVLQAKSDFEAFRASTQLKLVRKESEMLRTVYKDTSGMVAKYADYYKYTVVLRFQRQGVEDAASPQEAVNTMNKLVVFHRTQDDITDAVLKVLNDQYAKSGGGTPARSASNSRPAPRQ